MNNDLTELLKFAELHNYDVDKDKTTIFVDSTSSEITVHLYLNRRITGCPFCKSRSHYSHLHDKHQVLHELLSVDKDLKEPMTLKRYTENLT